MRLACDHRRAAPEESPHPRRPRGDPSGVSDIEITLPLLMRKFPTIGFSSTRHATMTHGGAAAAGKLA
jgi:hypothetical protein